ncbi:MULTISPECIES: hypothetical protein [Brevibacillus]|uniref:hypothetical protein n=1 Tax=Brevibacillus TaxID=55080 RepID=UPI00156B425C|nr:MULTISPECIES: hypothetical protein [Brevibacillus]MED2253534.1 hypothetical protein [Brevibacillus parabrevis]NRQ56345.1 hypothetical protein [Brevibacillus sp. HD1.4A]
METSKKTTRKSRLLLGLAAIGTLAVASSFSVATYAQSVLDGKMNVVMTEAAPPKELEGKETVADASKQQNAQAESQMVFPTAMSKEQAEPFIKAATEAFKARKIELPQHGYWISSKYIDNESKDVQIDWYPNSFDGIGPMNDIEGKVYFVYFTKADLQKGTGEIQTVRVIEQGGMPTAASSAN